ncbi:MAG: uroporphyrinogen decarboxylase family protein [Planctomycetota bacterium]
MNSNRRASEAMNHGRPDRVPVMCQLALGHYFLNCDYPPSEVWFDSNTFAMALIDLQQRYGFDGVLVNLPGRPDDWRRYLESSSKQGDTEVLNWSSGLVTVVGPDDNPQTFGPGKTPLERADYSTIDLKDPAIYRTPGYVWNTWHAPELWDVVPEADLAETDAYPQWFTAAVRAARKLGPEISVHAEVFSPFTHLLELFGYEQALFALVDKPQRCHSLLDVFAGFAKAQVELYEQCEPDAILVSSAFAGAGFISRDMYKEFVMPYEEQVYRTIAEQGVKSYVHTCGAIGDRLDLMAQTGVDGIDTLDPPPLGTVNLDKATAEYGERFFFKGNLDAVNEMLDADDQTFEAAVRQRLEIGKPGAGYILSSACSVAPRVKPRRLTRMVQLAEEFGKY